MKKLSDSSTILKMLAVCFSMAFLGAIMFTEPAYAATPTSNGLKSIYYIEKKNGQGATIIYDLQENADAVYAEIVSAPNDLNAKYYEDDLYVAVKPTKTGKYNLTFTVYFADEDDLEDDSEDYDEDDSGDYDDSDDDSTKEDYSNTDKYVSKTFTTTIYKTNEKWSNPASTFKFGSKNYTSKFKKNDSGFIENSMLNKSFKNYLISVKAKKGWTLKGVYLDNGAKQKKIKNNKKNTFKYDTIIAVFKNNKTGYNRSLSLFTSVG